MKQASLWSSTVHGGGKRRHLVCAAAFQFAIVQVNRRSNRHLDKSVDLAGRRKSETALRLRVAEIASAN